nr:hypothetical protein [Tanacetum cinerariifolium]
MMAVDGHPNIIEYTYSDESDEDKPSEADKSKIDPLIRESTDTFLIRDEEIKLNSHKDIDGLVPILRNEESDESVTETIMEEVQIHSSQSTAQIQPPYAKLTIDLTMTKLILTFSCFRNRGESFWEEGDDFRVDVLRFHTCLTDILGFLEKFGWWFEQDIDGESEDDNEKKLVMVNEEG